MPGLCRAIANRLRRLAASRGGNIALIFAIAAPVLVLVAGGAIDVTNASMRQAQLQQSLDAAALAAVARNSPAYQMALTMNADGPIVAPNEAAQTQAIFSANHAISNDTAVQPVTVSVTKAGNIVSSTATATGTFTPSFLGVVGIKTIKLAANSKASDNIPSYIDFYLLLDNTPSMGIGATNSDISVLTAATTLYNAGEANCAFACHATDPAFASENTYATARANNVTLRIDVVRQATQQLMNTATTTETNDGIASEFRVAIYDFGSSAYVSPALNTVSSLTPNLLTQSQSDAATIDLETVPSNNDAYQNAIALGSTYNNDQDTSFDYAFNAIGNIMVPTGMAGSGASAAQPQKILFVVTDGMVDMNVNGARIMGGIDPSTCTALKNKGIKIAVLYTTYLASSLSDTWSQQNTGPVLPYVAPALQACATPGLYYPVGPNQGISQAMAALFQNVVASVKITG